MDGKRACLRPSENCTFLSRLCKCSQTALQNESSRNHADRTELCCCCVVFFECPLFPSSAPLSKTFSHPALRPGETLPQFFSVGSQPGCFSPTGVHKTIVSVVLSTNATALGQNIPDLTGRHEADKLWLLHCLNIGQSDPIRSLK